MAKVVTFRDLAARQHGQSKAVREVAPTPIVVGCPECGSPLEVDEHALAFHPMINPREVHETRLAFCTACEFVHEF